MQENIEISSNEQVTNNKLSDKSEVSIYAGMNEIVGEANKIIQDMKQGERILTDDLTDKISSKLKLPQSNVKNLVSLFLKQCKDVRIEIGRGGGIFKGGRPKRIDARPRCHTCGQVVRVNGKTHQSEHSEESDNSTIST